MDENNVEIIAEHIGLNTPTKVICNDRVLVTQLLDIATLVELWKWYYRIPPFKKIVLKCETKLYNSLRQKTLLSNKSLMEIFSDNGVICEELKGESEK